MDSQLDAESLHMAITGEETRNSDFSLITLTLTEDEITSGIEARVIESIDLIEFRALDGPITEKMVEFCTKPILFRVKDISDQFVVGIDPWMIDIPYSSQDILSQIDQFRKKFPTSNIQISYHSDDNTQETGDNQDVLKLLEEMALLPVDAIKCALYPRSLDHALTLLLLIKSFNGVFMGKKCTIILMGDRFSFSRILGYAFHNYLTFTSLIGKKKASGQIDIDTLMNDYCIRSLFNFSSFYTLIGMPVEGSLSHKTHTHIFRDIFSDNGTIYLKIGMFSEEVKKENFEKMRSLLLKGVSVTSPLKKRVGELFTHKSTPINTLFFSEDNRVICTNTDVQALYKAIQQKSAFDDIRRVAILGIGDVAQSLAYELFNTFQEIDLYTRDSVKKNTSLRNARVVEYSRASQSIPKYDIIINATSDRSGNDLLLLFPIDFIQNNTLIAEFIYPEASAWFQAIRKKRENSSIAMISGKELWVKQAAQQFLFWRGDLSQELLEEKIELQIEKIIEI